VVKVLLSKKTKNKIRMLNNHEELREYFDEDFVKHMIEEVKVGE